MASIRKIRDIEMKQGRPSRSAAIVPISFACIQYHHIINKCLRTSKVEGINDLLVVFLLI